jgi:tetratricopeptide (TPR) repeat protein
VFKSTGFELPTKALLGAQSIASRNSVEGATEILRRAGGELPPVLATRVEADLRLETSKPTTWNRAAQLYESLLTNEAICEIDRADILFNLGVIHERLDQRESAIQRYEQAKQTNRLLESAEDRLVALS